MDGVFESPITMNTNIDQLDARRTIGRTGGLPATGVQSTPAVDPPERHLGWFSSYDEEWVAFVKEHESRRTHSGFFPSEPEALPRVWNCPNG